MKWHPTLPLSFSPKGVCMCVCVCVCVHRLSWEIDGLSRKLGCLKIHFREVLISLQHPTSAPVRLVSGAWEGHVSVCVHSTESKHVFLSKWKQKLCPIRHPDALHTFRMSHCKNKHTTFTMLVCVIVLISKYSGGRGYWLFEGAVNYGPNIMAICPKYWPVWFLEPGLG